MCIRKSLIVAVLAVLLTGTPAVTEAATYQYDTFACRFFNIVLKPFGGCQQEQEQSPAPSSTPVVSLPAPTAKIVPTPNPAPSDNLPATTSSQDTATPAINNITNEYITVQSSGVSESQLNARLALYALRSHSHTSNTDTNSPATIQAELDRLEALLDDRRLRQTDRVYDSISDSRSSITSGGTLTDTTLSGALTLPDITTNLLLYANSSGVLSAATGLNITNNSLTIGTTTAHEKLTIDGPIYLGSNTPAATTNRLYNTSGSLYWNGSVVAGASVGSWNTNGTDVYRLTGNVGIGTSTPQSKLSVIGDGYFSGNVGIGTTSPSARLTVAGDINLTAGSAYKYNGADVIIASTTLNNYFFGGAGNLTMTGSNNTANGFRALYSNTTGSNNTAYGRDALRFNTTGGNNTASGYSAIFSNTTGSFNTGIGRDAGRDVTTASNNTLIGWNAGRGITTGSNNTILGANVTGLSSTLSNNIIIADGAGNQRINVDGSGNVGIGTMSPSEKLSVSGNIKGSGVLNIDGTGDSYIQGDVGIGTNSPDSEFHVASTRTGGIQPFFQISGGKAAREGAAVSFTRTNNTQQALFAFETATASNPDGYIGAFGNKEDALYILTGTGGGTTGAIGVDDTLGLRVGTGSNIVSGSVGASITPAGQAYFAGNVGIGTTVPDTKLHVAGAITQQPLSSDPADPDAGNSVQWVSDGTGSGSAGDVMMKINVGGTTKVITLIDYSVA